MGVPLFHGKAELRSSYQPGRFLDALRAQGWEPGPVPETVLYTYARFELYLSTVPDLYTPNHMVGSGPNTFFVVNHSDGRLAINCLPIGAPATANQLGMQAELGVRRVIGIGTCGGLQLGAAPGDVVVATAALRDEGTSYHFLPPAEEVTPDPALTDELRDALTHARIPHTTGTTWTTDVPFRETAEEITAYRQRGISAVEMEAAGLFAAAEHYGISTASALVVDGVADASAKDWTLDLPAASTRLRHLFNTCVDWLSRPTS